MDVYFLSLGSNKGDRQRYLKEALSRLANLAGPELALVAPAAVCRRIRVLAVASLYETSPVGYTEQADFLNTAVAVATDMEPPVMLALCKRIEEVMGRATPFRWGPREIDLDLIWWGEVTGGEEPGDGGDGRLRACWVERKWESPALVIPHPRATERLFVLIPLAEIAPGLPIHGRPVESWIASLTQTSQQVNHLLGAGLPGQKQAVRKIAAADWHTSG